MTCLLEWPAGLSLRLISPRTSPLRLSEQRTSLLHLSDQRVSPFAWETRGPLPFVWVTTGSLPLVQNYRLYIVFSSSMRKYEYPLRLTYWLVIGTWILPFFPVICWFYQRTEISVTLSMGNKLYSRHHLLFFSFMWDKFVDVILRPYLTCQVHRRQLS